MRYKLRRADSDDDADLEQLISLHRETFGDTAPMKDDEAPTQLIFKRGAWWVLYPDGHEDTPIAFCGVVPSSYHPTYAYFKRAGVLKEHRGQGLQKRLIRVRERWARKHQFHWVITNTNNDNPTSGNSLIAEGYRLWWPPVPWDFRTAVYWRKRLLPPR